MTEQHERDTDRRDTRSRPVKPMTIPIEPRATDPASDAAELAARVAQVAKGGARAAVLGVNDGLVTNVCLILALAGAHATASSVRLAGFASLLAGCLSMAAGEWVSVRNQVELYTRLLGEVRQWVGRNPKLVLDNLSAHLEAIGFGRATAQTAAAELSLDEERFLDFTARALFGINTEELGSPLTAATTSLLYFAGGATVPLVPWFFTQGAGAAVLSVALTAAASLVFGAIVARLSDRPAAWGGLRQLIIAAGAAATTYGIGRLFGTTVS
jgi:VIT1/CCC1 family predicted Fe2+/Mn2+ transporter